jgi:fructose-bisphosphate aldolase, class I
MTGTALRLGRLFADDGHSTIVAFDHGMTLGVWPGADDPGYVLAEAVRGGPEGILLGPGLLAEHGGLFARRGAPAAILRTDLLFTGGHPHPGDHHRRVVDVSSAHRLGADALACYLALGYPDGAGYADNLASVGALIQEAHAVGLPVIVEVVAWGSAADGDEPALLSYGTRAACELGADAIKTTYPGSDGLRRIVAGTPAPVLVLGGSTRDWPELLSDTQRALEAGAAGTIYGRSVWQADGIAERLHELRALVHQPARV